MRKIIIASIVLCSALMYGCDKDKPITEGNIGSTVKTGNDTPEAKSAPVAPRDPSIIMPGGPKKGGGPKAPGGQ